MSGHGFISMFAAQLDAYVAFKKAMGCVGASRIWYLKQFDAYCAEHGRIVFDRDTVEGWVSSRLATSGRYRSWMSYVRDFGRWLRANGEPDAYVLSAAWKAPFVHARPYLLSAREIDAFFDAAADLDVASPWRWQASAFFTLMHSCGLRTGEVRALKPCQVDLDGGHIDVVWSKANRSRRLPLTSEIIDVLDACDRKSSASFASRQTFFVSAAGTAVTPAAVGVTFARIWDRAGLPRPAGGRRPRPYDFRHHFAYANVERWMENGADLEAMLPYLSRYMGHATFESTYYYIHTSPDFMDSYAALTRTGQSVLPEVGFE